MLHIVWLTHTEYYYTEYEELVISRCLETIIKNCIYICIALIQSKNLYINYTKPYTYIVLNQTCTWCF